jgi:hypothetical protein
MSEHTPLPWRLEKQDDLTGDTCIGGPIAIIGGDECGEGVEFVLGRTCDYGPHGDEETTANALFIHRAVNCHDELVAALRGFLEPGEPEPVDYCKARAILAKAEGKK